MPSLCWDNIPKVNPFEISMAMHHFYVSTNHLQFRESDRESNREERNM